MIIATAERRRPEVAAGVAREGRVNLGRAQERAGTDHNHMQARFQKAMWSPRAPGNGDVPAERKMDPQHWRLKPREIDVEGKERTQTRTHLTTTYIQGF